MPIFSTTGMGVNAVKLVTHRFAVNAPCNPVFLGSNTATAGRGRRVYRQVLGRS
jgi:hypothetical protein